MGQTGQLRQRGSGQTPNIQETHTLRDPQEILDKIVDVVLKYKPPKKPKKLRKKQ